ncbi:MAG: GNAT family N-acetyltransferase [Planctomycetes bacterium]|nr:GNAT family N-acetyltransferase [Planctomycetota bacterium]
MIDDCIKTQMPAKHNDISLFVIYEEDISPQQDRALREMLVVCFPPDIEYFRRQSFWHSPAVYRVIGKNDKGSIVAHTAIVEREVIVGPSSSKVRVAGIQSFCVLQDYRGMGLSNRMMSVVLEEGNKRGFDVGLLFCREQLEKVYSDMGWRKLDAAVYMNDDKNGKTLIPSRNMTMFYPLNSRQFPAGDIDLAGADW